MVGFARIAELEGQGRSFAVATVIRARGSTPRRAGARMLIFPDGSQEGTIGGGEFENRVISEALDALARGRHKTLHYRFADPEQGDPGVCGGEVDVYIEPVQPPPKLVIFGAGHVGKAVAHLGAWLGFQVVVADDRSDFATPDQVPQAARHITCLLSRLPEEVGLDERTYVVLTTRNVAIDVEGLPALLQTPVPYIGVIGSRRRWETTLAELEEKGVSAGALERVSSPVGLEINAETPEEIAVSILGEIIMLRRGGRAQRMAHKPPSRARSAGG
jgi:xanthine dehydrogenase accessory factor